VDWLGIEIIIILNESTGRQPGTFVLLISTCGSNSTQRAPSSMYSKNKNKPGALFLVLTKAVLGDGWYQISIDFESYCRRTRDVIAMTQPTRKLPCPLLRQHYYFDGYHIPCCLRMIMPKNNRAEIEIMVSHSRFKIF
jgi:hypothetical protein